MRARRAAAALVAAVCLAAPLRTGALVLNINQDQIYHAIDIGRSSARDRARFHDAYVRIIDHPVVEQIDVKTEFRRVVLEAEDHVRVGDHVWGANQAVAFLKPFRGIVTISAKVRFNPQNVLVSLPAYDVVLDTLEAHAVRRTPVFAPAAPKQKASVLLGAVIEADFDAARVGQASRVVGVVLDQGVVRVSAVDFSKIQ